MLSDNRNKVEKKKLNNLFNYNLSAVQYFFLFFFFADDRLQRTKIQI